MRNTSIVWLPILLVGSLVYWTLAFGFGGRSLVLLTQFEYGLVGPDWSDKDSYQTITVNVSEPPRPGEDDGQEAASVRVDLIQDQTEAIGDGSGQGAHSGANRQGPGDTAF